MTNSRGRTVVLAAVLALFAMASSWVPAFAHSASFLKFPVAGLLLLHFLIFPAEVKFRSARSKWHLRFLVLLWTLSVLAFLSVLWSVDPKRSLLQAIGFTLMVSIVHVGSTRIWVDAALLQWHLRVVFAVTWLAVSLGLVVNSTVQGRSTGIFTNANQLAAMGAFAFAMGLSRHVVAWPLVARLIVCLPPAFLVVRSESRTAFLACGLVLLYYTVRRLSEKAFVAVCAFGSVACILLLLNIHLWIPRVITRFGSAPGEPWLNGRQTAWSYAFDIWRRRPVEGVGFRAGEIAFQHDRALAPSFQLDGAHSSYVQLLLELGLLGAGLGALLLVVLLFAAYRSRKRFDTSPLGAIIVVGLATGITESALLGVGQAISWTFWIGAGMAVCAEFEPDPRPRSLRSQTSMHVRT